MRSPRKAFRAKGNGTRSKASADSRFDRRLGEILAAAQVFHEKGYEGASMRDLSRRTGMSLAGGARDPLASAGEVRKSAINI